MSGQVQDHNPFTFSDWLLRIERPRWHPPTGESTAGLPQRCRRRASMDVRRANWQPYHKVRHLCRHPLSTSKEAISWHRATKVAVAREPRAERRSSMQRPAARATKTMAKAETRAAVVEAAAAPAQAAPVAVHPSSMQKPAVRATRTTTRSKASASAAALSTEGGDGRLFDVCEGAGDAAASPR